MPLRAFFWGNALVQLGLLAVELAAHREGVIALGGIVPNAVLHVVLASGFLAYSRGPVPPAQSE